MKIIARVLQFCQHLTDTSVLVGTQMTASQKLLGLSPVLSADFKPPYNPLKVKALGGCFRDGRQINRKSDQLYIDPRDFTSLLGGTAAKQKLPGLLTLTPVTPAVLHPSTSPLKKLLLGFKGSFFGLYIKPKRPRWQIFNSNLSNSFKTLTKQFHVFLPKIHNIQFPPVYLACPVGQVNAAGFKHTLHASSKLPRPVSLRVAALRDIYFNFLTIKEN